MNRGIKNHKLKDCAANYMLDWIGMTPSKREAWRLVGDVTVIETATNTVGGPTAWPTRAGESTFTSRAAFSTKPSQASGRTWARTLSTGSGSAASPLATHQVMPQSKLFGVFYDNNGFAWPEGLSNLWMSGPGQPLP